MPEFSACYFCGTALDAPLAEYPVVPEALHPAADQQRTVVLCPTCRRKLGAVVDTVVAALDDSPEANSIQQELQESRGNGLDTSPDEGTVSAERLDAGETTDDPLPPDETTQGESSETTQGETDPSAETVADDFGGAAGKDESEQEFDDDNPAEEAEPETGAAATGEGRDVDEGTEQAAAGADEQAAGSEEAEDDPQMTALEYNKVMRLLQNREFPVDKAEFKVVATNAYDIEDDEFEAVIEAAEKRDLIAVENGQIVDG